MKPTELAQMISRVLSDQFPEAAIERVIVKSDVDEDGDKVLRITVIVASAIDRLDSDRLGGIVRHLRTEMPDQDDFPILSFVTKKEAAQLKLEAA